MTDDVPSSDTLSERLAELRDEYEEDVGYDGAPHVFRELAKEQEDAIEALVHREEQVKRLKAALHEHAIKKQFDVRACTVCLSQWGREDRESHRPDCLLAGFEPGEDDDDA